MLNRVIAPVHNPVLNINWLPAESTTLKNGIRMHLIDSAHQDLVKIEWVYRAGIKHQQRALEAAFCSSLMKEGTKKHAAADFNEMVDFCGAFLQTEYDRDFASVTLFCLNKYLERLLPLVREMLTEPVFSRDSFEVHVRNSLQQYLTEEAKVSTQARKKLTRLVMGENHYYGSFAQVEDYNAISRDNLIDFHRRCYLSLAPEVFVSGRISSDFTRLFTENFENINFGSGMDFTPRRVAPISGQVEWVAVPDAVQYAVRWGKLVPGPTHPDYFKLKVAVTMLGGYFGSRLMKNIREDKGYTYGIQAGTSTLEELTMLLISTEVGNDYIHATLQEIEKELDMMRNLPNEDELALVKNYIAGNLVKEADGALAQADKLRFRTVYKLPETYYQSYIGAVNAVTARDVQEMAETYLQPDSFQVAIAGKQADAK